MSLHTNGESLRRHKNTAGMHHDTELYLEFFSRCSSHVSGTLLFTQYFALCLLALNIN